MAQVRNIRPGYTVIHPNRDKASCKLTRLLVVLILLASVALMLLVTIGGWSKLQGLKPVNFIWCIVYVLIAIYIWRWARGLLPIAAALAILLLIVAVIAGTGLAGTSWSDRNHSGFAAPQSLLGGSGFTPSTLAFLTILMIPVEVALIVVAMIAFSQGWNVESEVPDEEAQKRGSKPVGRGPEAATA
ncbi:MAG TPA: hypothetical protein VGL51_20580 [Solirubrobacteraceae bacterium]